MTDERSEFRADETVTRLLRERFAPPADDSYWHALEVRIMAGIAGADHDAWWQPFGGWVRTGMFAAAASLLLTAMSLRWAGSADAQTLYQAVAASPVETLPVASEGGSASAREATLEYLITH